MSAELQKRLGQFTDWTDAHVRGDEKGEAQIFLDRFFQALGHPGCLDVGGSPEFRIRKGKGEGGGTAFADYVWKPRVLIEMKKRGEDLSRHYRQAFDYWVRLVPGRPRYAILCNFDEFWVYDFETQMDAPLDVVRLKELSNRWGALTFLLPEPKPPIFGNDQEAVTRVAAHHLARCFRLLTDKSRVSVIDRSLARRFTLQMLVCLFAEDIGLLEKYFVTRLLDECKSAADTYDLLGGLFTQMNTPGRASGGRYRGVGYFNGGLFLEPARIELRGEELEELKLAAKQDWAKVRPEIFGTLFEQSMEADERHAFGAHFTSPVDIMKIVGPTIVSPWRHEIESASTLKKLLELRVRLENFQVLDPACGSGNFLYIAYRELKRLEARLQQRLAEEFKSVGTAQQTLGFLSVRNFFGLDINPFAVELAKVTMEIGHKLAIDELKLSEEALPLSKLDANFRASDALVDEFGNRTPWPKADVIIGNPPFLGAKRLKPERGPDYANAIRKLYPEVPGMADYCVYWFRRTHDLLSECSSADPVAGRAGLVGTQNVRNNQSRVGGLDAIVSTGTIVDAVENQPWSGDAAVHVSIVNWVKSKDPIVVGKERRLWFVSAAGKSIKVPRRRGAGPASKEYELDCRAVSRITSSLSDQIDVSKAAILSCNVDPKRVFQGVTPGHAGFVLTTEEKDALLAKDRGSEEVIRPYLIGRELVSGDGIPERFLIDFDQRDLLDASSFDAAFGHVQEIVLPDRMGKAEKGKDADGNMRPHHKGFLDRWWRLSWDRAEMKAYFKGMRGRYITASRTQSWPFVFCFMSTAIVPGDKLQIFAFDDDYSFGVLQSSAHQQWYRAKAARLKNEKDYNYSTESVFDTFPWPQAPDLSAFFGPR